MASVELARAEISCNASLIHPEWPATRIVESSSIAVLGPFTDLRGTAT